MATTKPISVLVIGMGPTPALEQLVTDGHTVQYPAQTLTVNPLEWDMIVGPKCWRYLPDVSDKWLPLLLKEARAAQPPRIKKAKVKKSGVAAS